MLADVDLDLKGRAEPLRGPRLTLADNARLLAESIPDGLLLVDSEGRITYVNERLLAMTGYAPSDLVGATIEVLVPLDMRASHVRHRQAFAARPAHRPAGGTLSLRVRRADGTVFPADIALNPTRWEGRDVVIAVVSDLTPRRRADDLRTMQFTVTRILTDSASLVEAGPPLLQVIARTLEMDYSELWIIEPDGASRPVCSHLSPQSGASDAAAFAARSRAIRARACDGIPAQEVDPGSALSFTVPRGRATALFLFMGRAGSAGASDAADVIADIGDQIGHFVEKRRMEAALAESMARLAEVAATDPLTGIRNRREFDRLLATIPRRRFAVLAADLDHLKRLNDEYGHEAGDVALRAVASTMVAALRGWDVVARTGGDEFSVLMSDVSPREAARAAERLRAAVEAISVPFGQVQISVGWATGSAGSDPRAIADLADAHLYEAKRGGRDQVVGSPVSKRGGLAARRSEWSARIDAILADHKATVVFQPITRLSDGSVVGHEALTRPLDFGATDSVEDLFAEAHRTGRIRDLDWLCRRLAIAAIPWPVAGSWALFLNVSAVPLLDPVHAVDQLMLVLKAAGARADQVVLEITERELISDMERVRNVLASYREQGFRFALDDVGEGHSTLELLAAATPEYIKVARSLTMTAAHSSSRAAIRAAIAFAQVSGATVIAEGVENELAARQMMEMGVALGQGWWLGRPGPLDLLPRPRAGGAPAAGIDRSG